MAYLKNNVLDFYYQEQGEGHPLVLIHGLGSSSRDWELQMDAFEEYFKVITLDLRGHGKTSKPRGPYNMPLFAADTAWLIKELGIGPVFVLGISLGGMVGFQLAIDHPEIVGGLVIVNSTPDMKPRSVSERITLWQRFLIVRLMGMEKMGEVLANRFLPHPDQEELRKVFIERWAENDKDAYLEAMKAVVGWSVLERLGEIHCPTLVIGADGDYFSIADKEAYTSMIPNAQLKIVENTMHALPAEKPEEFNQIVLDFLLQLA
jgi:pimeloyl-ACP methyl ester carboxylesterase